MITGELLSLSQLHFFTLVILLKGKKRGISESLRNHYSHLIAFTLWLNTSSCCRSDPVFSFVGFSQNLSWFIQVCSNYLCAVLTDRLSYHLNPENNLWVSSDISQMQKTDRLQNTTLFKFQGHDNTFCAIGFNMNA